MFTKETRRYLSACFMSYCGCDTFLSGRGDSIVREWARVVSIVAAAMPQHFLAFSLVSNQVAGLRLRVSGAFVDILCAYAPHTFQSRGRESYFS